jgi:hypothetical protein
VPPCRRKAATKGRRLLCAAADASSLLYRAQRQPPGGSGFLAPAGLLPGHFFGGVATASGVPANDPRLLRAVGPRVRRAYLGPCVVILMQQRSSTPGQAPSTKQTLAGQPRQAGGQVVGSAGCQPNGHHTMTDRVLLALALALLALIIAAVILYVAGVVPIFVG